MARGIIVAKPAGGTSGSTAGRILLTDPNTSGSADSSSDSTSSSGSAVALEIGSPITYSESSSANVGDVVDFTIDSTTNEAKGISTVTSGNVISGTLDDNLTVAAGQSVVVAGRVEGKVAINGGSLTLLDGSSIGGKIDSTTAGSVFFAGKCSVEGKIEYTGASNLSLQGTTVEGKVNSNGNVFASVVGCNIKGKLDVTSATRCKCSGNTVDGQINTPNC